MKAIVYEGANTISVQDVPKPQPREGWALIKVSHAGICGTDQNIYHGTHPRAKAPLIMGHEFSGTLESDDVPGIKKGTRVTVYPLLSCGKCEPCKTGNMHVCNTLGLVGIDCDGGFAEYVEAPKESIIPLSDKVSNKMGAFVEPVAVCVHALRERDFRPGDNALVFGCGTIGLATAMTLRVFGASSILMMETDSLRAEYARSMGFEVVDPTKLPKDMEAYCKDRTDGNGFDWVIDCAGVQPVASLLLDAVKVRGTILIIAAYAKPATLPLIKGMFKETNIQFTRVYRKKDFAIAAKIVAEDPGFEKIITHVLPVSEAQKGFDLVTTKGSGAIKVMFCFD